MYGIGGRHAPRFPGDRVGRQAAGRSIIRGADQSETGVRPGTRGAGDRLAPYPRSAALPVHRQLFDDQRELAFARDLRVTLNDLTESGSKRGTSAAGFLVSDERLRYVVQAWSAAEGEWPEGSNPDNPNSLLYALEDMKTGTYDINAPSQNPLSGI